MAYTRYRIDLSGTHTARRTSCSALIELSSIREERHVFPRFIPGHAASVRETAIIFGIIMKLTAAYNSAASRGVVQRVAPSVSIGHYCIILW